MGRMLQVEWPKQINPTAVAQLIRSEKNLEKAISIFDDAIKEYSNGYRHDSSTFSVIVRKLLSANRFVPAEDMLVRMKQENCGIDEDLFGSIYLAYGRVHRPFEALRVFGKMKEYGCEPTAKSYVTVFSILVDENQLTMAFKFYRHMRENGMQAGVPALNVLIKALCKSSGTLDSAFRIFREMPKRGHTPDSYTYGTLINGLSRARRLIEARELLVEMEANGCLPNVIMYSSLINCFCKSGKLEDALQLFRQMKIKGIDPNVYTYSSLIDALCRNGHSTQALNLLARMITGKVVPNSITYSSLIFGLCKDGNISEAVQILNRMKLQDLKPGVKLYSKIINGFCDTNKFIEASNFLDEMVLSGIGPKHLTWGLYDRVIQGLCSENHPNRAFPLYLSLRNRGISVGMKLFECLILCFCKSGDMHKASRILDEMVSDGCIPEEGTWNVMLDGFWDREKVREAAAELQDKLISEFENNTSS